MTIRIFKISGLLVLKSICKNGQYRFFLQARKLIYFPLNDFGLANEQFCLHPFVGISYYNEDFATSVAAKLEPKLIYFVFLISLLSVLIPHQYVLCYLFQ